MTDDEIKAAHELCGAATHGEWEFDEAVAVVYARFGAFEVSRAQILVTPLDTRGRVPMTEARANGRLAAASRTLVPRLLAKVEQLMQECDGMQTVIDNLHRACAISRDNELQLAAERDEARALERELLEVYRRAANLGNALSIARQRISALTTGQPMPQAVRDDLCGLHSDLGKALTGSTKPA